MHDVRCTMVCCHIRNDFHVQRARHMTYDVSCWCTCVCVCVCHSMPFSHDIRSVEEFMFHRWFSFRSSRRFVSFGKMVFSLLYELTGKVLHFSLIPFITMSLSLDVVANANLKRKRMTFIFRIVVSSHFFYRYTYNCTAGERKCG